MSKRETETVVYYGDEWEFQRYIPEGFEKTPETVLEVLQASRALLAEEGRWISGSWFQNEHPGVDPEDAFCNSWAVCAAGAVQCVTVGTMREKDSGATWQLWGGVRAYSYCPNRELYTLVIEALTEALPTTRWTTDWDVTTGEYVRKQIQWDNIPDWNDADGRTRTEVLAVFDQAIANEQAKLAASQA